MPAAVAGRTPRAEPNQEGVQGVAHGGERHARRFFPRSVSSTRNA